MEREREGWREEAELKIALSKLNSVTQEGDDVRIYIYIYRERERERERGARRGNNR